MLLIYLPLNGKPCILILKPRVETTQPVHLESCARAERLTYGTGFQVTHYPTSRLHMIEQGDILGGVEVHNAGVLQVHKIE